MVETIEEKKVNILLSRKEEGKKRLEKVKGDDLKPVKGKFIFHECPGGSVRIVCKKYKDIPMFDMTMDDGKEYEIPMYVARHLNGTDKCATELNGIINTCAYPIHKNTVDSQGNARIDIGQWVRRFSFQSLEFIA